MSQNESGSTPLNQSIERAVQLLGFFTPNEPELTLTELTSRLGMTKATAHRYAVVLRSVGLLRYDADRGVYTLGPRIVELAASALAGLRIIKIAGPHMEELVAEVNQTVVLSIWNGQYPVVIHVEDNTRSIVRVVVRVGARLPLYNSAQGRIFAAFTPEFAHEELHVGLSDVRATRVAIGEEIVPGIRAIAAPVFQDRDLVAALAIVGTTAAIPDDPQSIPASRLLRTAEIITTQLGFIQVERKKAR